MDIINAALIVIGFLSLFLTLLVFSRNSKNSVNISFSLFILNATLWAFVIAFFRMANTYESSLFWMRGIYISGTFVPVAFLYFSSIITQKKSPRLVLQILYLAVPLIFLFILFYSNLWVSHLEFVSREEKYVRFGPMYAAWVFYFSSFMGLGVFKLFKALQSASNMLKVQIKYILLSVLFPIIGSFPFNIVLPYFGNYQLIFIGPIFITVMIVIISYAIVRHRLLDIRLVFARSLTYTLLTLVLGIIYAGGLFLVSPYLTQEKTSFDNAVISTFLALIIAFSFQPLLALFEKVTNKFFYRDHYGLKEILYSLSQQMAVTVSLKEVAAGISSVLINLMHVSNIDFVLLAKGKFEVLSASQKPRVLSMEEFHVLNIRGKLLVIDEVEEEDVKTIMQKHAISVYVPLKTGNTIIGCLLLGEKTSGNIYFDQDLKVLEIVGPELSIAVQNAQSFEEIKQFNVTLEQEVNKATMDLKKANVRLQELDHMKDEFFSLASHELRTPLTAIRGNAQLIRDNYSSKIPDKDFSEMINDIHDGSIRLIQIVNDFLNVSRLEQGKIEFKKEVFLLPEFLHKLMDGMKTVSDGQKIELTCNAAADVPQVLADPDRVQEVVYNLVGNAIKFTKQGNVTLSALQEGDDFVKISVTDTGAGIPLDKQNLLFQKFQQAGDVLTPEVSQGSGLGLYISKLLIEGMKGKIFLEKSEAGKGSTFSFTLPIAK